MTAKWSAADVPDQSGRVAIVTGANSGLGYDTAAVLAGKGAHVVLAVRNIDKGNDAKGRITAASPNAVVTVQELDLTSLDNIRKAADELRAAHPRIDLLINNAGVMYTDKAKTKDGFELTWGTNHLGPYLFTRLLLDRIKQAGHARIVNVASASHYNAHAIDWDAMKQPTQSSTGMREYAVSKLANVLHAVLTQQLIPRRDDEGMALAMEMLMITPAIRKLIREAKTFQIQSLLQTGASSGMLTMEQSLKGLVDKRWISADDALESCFDPKEMARLLGRK